MDSDNDLRWFSTKIWHPILEIYLQYQSDISALNISANTDINQISAGMIDAFINYFVVVVAFVSEEPLDYQDWVLPC